MKRYSSLKRIITAALSLLLLFALAAPASAADSEVRFNGPSSLFGFVPNDGSATGLFNNLQGLMPGGTYEQEITIKNPSDRRVEIYLRGEPLNASQEGVNLLSKVKFTLEDEDGTVLVSDASDTSMQNIWPTSGTNTGDGVFIHLGRFYSGDSMDLTLKLEIPADLDNSYQNASGTVRWTFQADVYRRDNDDDDDDDDDDDIPLGPPVIIIDDGQQIPLSPGTGDDTNLYIWAGGFIVLAGALSVLIAKRRKES